MPEFNIPTHSSGVSHKPLLELFTVSPPFTDRVPAGYR